MGSIDLAQPAARPRGSEFVFARLRYDSGDWDYNPKVAANVLNSIVEYTNIKVYGEEVVITADSDELGGFPFLFMTGHKLVRFSAKERERLAAYVRQGGLLFSDDCNHDVAGLYAVSFEQEMRTIFPWPAHPRQAAEHASALSRLLRVSRWAAADRARAERLGRRPRARLPSRRSSTTAGSASSTRTRTTAASGTTTGATSVFSATTTPGSASTSSPTR